MSTIKPPRVLYQSNYTVDPQITGAFPHASELDHDVPGRHIVLGDKELFDRCGYATHDEAAILRAVAATTSDAPWIEIGTHTGWTAAHIHALGGPNLICFEPEFARCMYNLTGDPARFERRFVQNMHRATGTSPSIGLPEQMPEYTADLINGTRRLVLGVPAMSWDVLPGMVGKYNGRFGGAFIDGEHCYPFPLIDAMLVEPLLKTDCIVAFHDGIGGPVVMAAEWFYAQKRSDGVKAHIFYFNTPQIITVVAVGRYIPVIQDIFDRHEFDRSVDWLSRVIDRDRAYREFLGRGGHKHVELLAYAKGFARRSL